MDFVEEWFKVLALFTIISIVYMMSLAFSYPAIFFQSQRYLNHRKMLSCCKAITVIVYFKLLLDIGNGKPASDLGAACVIHFLFLAGLSTVFSSGNQAFHFTKNWLPSKLPGCLG